MMHLADDVYKAIIKKVPNAVRKYGSEALGSAIVQVSRNTDITDIDKLAHRVINSLKSKTNEEKNKPTLTDDEEKQILSKLLRVFNSVSSPEQLKSATKYHDLVLTKLGAKSLREFYSERGVIGDLALEIYTVISNKEKEYTPVGEGKRYSTGRGSRQSYRKVTSKVDKTLDEDLGSSDWTAALKDFERDLSHVKDADDIADSAYSVATSFNELRKYSDDPWTSFTPKRLLDMALRREIVPKELISTVQGILSGKIQVRIAHELDEEALIKRLSQESSIIKGLVTEDKCPECGGPLVSEEMLHEKKDACYYKVKSRYKVWPSAYASGALVKCRKKGAKNWGKKSVKENKGLPMPGTYEQEYNMFKSKGPERIIAMTNEGDKDVAEGKKRKKKKTSRSLGRYFFPGYGYYGSGESGESGGGDGGGGESVNRGMAEGKECPPATQDITLNLKNRQKAINEYGYGPLNPDMPNTKFWMKKVDEWNLDGVEEAQNSLCGNCAAFDQRQYTLDCIAQGIDSDNPKDAEGVINAGELGYCKFLKFKCASRRTCDAWVTGGPLTDAVRDVAEGITPNTIHKLADRKGVKWDNEPSFLKLTKRLTGKEHLDDLNKIELRKVKQYLEKQGMAEGTYREGGSITHDGVEYDFDRVMSIAEKLPIKTCSVENLSWILKYDTPTDEKRIERADITVPLIVTKSINGKLAAIDGLHRLAKAVRNNVKTLPVKYIITKSMPSAKISKQGVAEGSKKVKSLVQQFFVESLNSDAAVIEYVNTSLIPEMRKYNVPVSPENHFTRISSAIFEGVSSVIDSGKDFLETFKRLDQRKKMKIAVGQEVSILNLRMSYDFAELFGFKTPKQITKIYREPTDNKIVQLEFNNDPEDVWPRKPLASFNGKLIITSAFFPNATEMEKSLTALKLATPENIKVRTNISEGEVVPFRIPNTEELKNLASEWHTYTNLEDGPEQERIENELSKKGYSIEYSDDGTIIELMHNRTGRKILVPADDALNENLHKWFQEKWVRFGPDGKIRGDCARGSDSEGKPKCLPQKKAQSLGKEGRASAAARKRRQDPNPERSGKAKNVATKKKSNEGVAEGEVVPFLKKKKVFSFTKNQIIQLKALCQTALELNWEDHLMPTAYQGPISKLSPQEQQQIFDKNEAQIQSLGYQYTPDYSNPNTLFLYSIEREAWWDDDEPPEDYYGPPDLKYDAETNTLSYYNLINSKDYAYTDSTQFESVTEEEVTEKWSAKYKRSINCNNPKGFSQRAHCQGRKKGNK